MASEAGINELAIERAAALCVKSYDRVPQFEGTHTYRPYRFPGGHLRCALQRFGEDAYVVFRGTTAFGHGNWLWTNFQAFAVTPPVPRNDEARVHVGFLKAFLWVWKTKDLEWRDKVSEVWRWARYLVTTVAIALLAILLVLIKGKGMMSWQETILDHRQFLTVVAGVGGVLVVAVARGWVEWLVHPSLPAGEDGPYYGEQ